MKIAFIFWQLNLKGGAPKQFLRLARGFVEKGYEVEVYCVFFEKNNTYKELIGDLKIKYLLYKSRKDQDEFYKCSFLRAVPIINRILNIFRSIYLENKLAKQLAFLIDKNVDILNPHDLSAFKVAYYFKKYIKNIPSVYICNDVPSYRFNFERWEKKPNIIKRFLAFVLDFYNKKFLAIQDVIIVLDHWNETGLRKYFGLPSVIIRPGITIPTIKREKKSIDKNSTVNLLVVSVLDAPHRRTEDAIKALRIILDNGYKAQLTIAGSFVNPEYVKFLHETVKKLNLSDFVKFLGSISEEELLYVYKNSDIFIFPNHNQTWGLVVFEALSIGVPVVLSKTTGAAEVLEDGINCIKVNPKTPDEIAEAVINLINDEKLYINLSKEGKKFVEESLSWSRYLNEVEQIFVNLLKKGMKK
ncbi:MAG: glycosyltransferase family 4 protein [Candidatus Aenigmatarchaeota archaeon]